MAARSGTVRSAGISSSGRHIMPASRAKGRTPAQTAASRRNISKAHMMRYRLREPRSLGREMRKRQRARTR